MLRYVQTHFLPLALVVYNKKENISEYPVFVLRRAPMYSMSFLRNFGNLILPNPCLLSDSLGNIMKSARLQVHHRCNLKDRKNNTYTCSLHIFNSTYQIFILIIPHKKIRHINSSIYLTCI